MSKNHSHVPSDTALKVKALESLLVEKGLVDPGALDAILDTYQDQVGPQNGAHVVARAWVDPEFRQRLLQDGTATVRELGYYGRQGEHITVVENTPERHNLVVCTLCSCYPWTLLGLPPTWYKSPPYRSRAVSEPADVLAEFGTILSPGCKIRVWDSTSEMRYLVLPMRPDGTENWSEEQLQKLVSRNSMIGVELARDPGEST